MKFLFTCGGTAGHINPALSVAGRIKELLPDSEILFIGAEGHMETELVPREGYALETIRISSLSRSLSLAGLRHNLHAAKDLASSMPAAKRIIQSFRPDVVVGTGGYVGYPVLKEAAGMGIPTAVHESNAMPGLTTKMLENSVDVIMVGFESARNNYKHPDKVRVTGTPVRMDFLRSDRARARAALGLDEETPLVVSVWGSLGATEMNKTVGGVVKLGMEDSSFRFIHSAGKRGIASMREHMETVLGLSDWEEKGFFVQDYIYNMAETMAAADIVLCRSGASTLAELTAMGKPCILVPSPNVVNDHQTKNANVLGDAGGAVVITEPEATAERLYATIRELLSDREHLAEMGRVMRSLSVENATDEITSLVLSLAAR